MQIEITDLQEDILRLAVENPEMTNEEIAELLDCSAEWVGEVRRRYEHSVDETELEGDLKTVSGTARNPPKPKSEKDRTDYDLGIVAATIAWWLPILPMLQGNQPPTNAWLFLAGGWIGVPAMVFLDCKQRRSIGGGLIYTVSSVFLPMFAGLVYLHRRN